MFHSKSNKKSIPTITTSNILATTITVLIVAFNKFHLSTSSTIPPNNEIVIAPFAEPIPPTTTTPEPTTTIPPAPPIIDSNSSSTLPSIRTEEESVSAAVAGGDDNGCPYASNVVSYASKISGKGFNLTRSGAIAEASNYFAPLALLKIVNNYYDECFELFIKAYSEELIKSKKYSSEQVDGWIEKWKASEGTGAGGSGSGAGEGETDGGGGGGANTTDEEGEEEGEAEGNNNLDEDQDEDDDDDFRDIFVKTLDKNYNAKRLNRRRKPTGTAAHKLNEQLLFK